MKAKKVESLRQKMGSSKVVRLLTTSPFIDDKWIDDPSKLKKYLVVRYKKENDQYLPVWKEVDGKKVQWWESDTHDKLKSKVKDYSAYWKRAKKDSEKMKKAKFLLKDKASFEYYHTDDFMDAQDKYIEWGGNSLSYLTVNGTGGDD